MKILFATSECAPFSKTGGLADVAASLPPALTKAGDQVAVITPYYQCVREKFGKEVSLVKKMGIKLGDKTHHCGIYRLEREGVTIWFLENDGLFNRPKLYGYDDDKFRFAYFSRAIIEVLPELDFMPEILHCNDWETAAAIVYLKNDQSWRNDLQGIKTVFTIHNIAYQGQFGASELWDTFGLPEGWYDGGLGFEYDNRHDINLMKGAMLMADAVSTVSPTYAKELHFPEYGMGLQGVADIVENKMFGILNGIDEDLYNPEKDPRIAKNFSQKRMAGKAVCKDAIQDAFDIVREKDWPLLAFVARLNEQKGIEIIKEALPGIMDLGIQMIVFGQGDQQYVDYFNWAKRRWPEQFGFSSDYNDDMAAQIFAGADFYLMPSRFEPCGLSQMMAMRYGTVPIVHEVGGLKDSIRNYSNFDGLGDGFKFSAYNSKALYQTVLQAIKVYFGRKEMFLKLRERCMRKDFSWTRSAEEYEHMYSEIYEESSMDELTFEEAFEKLKAVYEEVDLENHEIAAGMFTQGYHRVIEIQITGRGGGVMYVEFTDGVMDIQPFTYEGADCKIAASLDNLIAMAKGDISPDRLFMNGQMKISGNLSKGQDMRALLRHVPVDQKTKANRSVKTSRANKAKS